MGKLFQLEMKHENDSMFQQDWCDFTWLYDVQSYTRIQILDFLDLYRSSCNAVFFSPLMVSSKRVFHEMEKIPKHHAISVQFLVQV